MTRFKAWKLGYADGKASPFYLDSGITWDKVAGAEAFNEAYDRGVNAGQWVGALKQLRLPQYITWRVLP